MPLPLIRISLILFSVFLPLRFIHQFWFELPVIGFIVMVYTGFPAIICLGAGIYYWANSRHDSLRESITVGFMLSFWYGIMLMFFLVMMISGVGMRGIAPLHLSYIYLGELFGILGLFGGIGALIASRRIE